MESDDLVGRSVGRYRVIRRLNEGGMCIIYQADDPILGRLVAIKVLKLFLVGDPDEFRKRFEREARMLAFLQHPNIVPVIDFGTIDGRYPYLVLPYLPGGTLRDRTGQAMPYVQAARLLAPVANALAYAHRDGVIHRDIKPTNILFTASGDPMLTDFGIAKLFLGQNIALTPSGAAVGTPGYMAPEQWKGETVPQTDVFALGVVFYELVTGSNPYAADTPQKVMYKQLMEPLPPPTDFVSDLPKNVQAVLLRAMANDPADRYPTMEAFARALQELAEGAAPALASFMGQSAPLPLQELSAARAQPLADKPPADKLPVDTPPVVKTPPVKPPAVMPPAPSPETMLMNLRFRLPGNRREWSFWSIIAGTLVVLLVAFAWLPPLLSSAQASAREPLALATRTVPIVSQAALPTAVPPTLAPTPPSLTPTVVPAAGPVQVLWDASHEPHAGDGGLSTYDPTGLYSSLSALLDKEGVALKTNQASLDKVDLSGYTAVVIAEWSAKKPYTPGEADLLYHYVERGGGLLILADKPDPSLRSTKPVITRFNIQPSGEWIAGDFTLFRFSRHPLTQGVTHIRFVFDGESFDADPRDTVVTADQKAAVLALDDLPGRVVVIGDGNLFDNRGLAWEDHQRFAQNVFRWITRLEPVSAK